MGKGRVLLVFSVLFMLFILFSFSATAQDYLALQGSANGTNTASGNVTVEIWSANETGSLLYNSSSNFWGQLNNSRYDILLGNGSQPLSLNFSMTYYMELIINERDIDFNGTERQVFQSPVGNITVNDPIKTTSTSASALNINDVFNVSGSNGNAVSNGTLQITNNDADDALNITTGGAFIRGEVVLGNFFNISAIRTAIRTNGTITTLSADVDDALNITSGGAFISGQIRTNAQNGFRAANPSNTISVQIDGGITSGNFFNVTVQNSRIRTNGTFIMSPPGVMFLSGTDPDDALNITDGGMVIHTGNVTVGNNATQNQHHIDIGISGSLPSGSNKCSYITMLDEGGTPHFLFFDTGGQLRVLNASPSTCDAQGQIVGTQS